MKTKLKAALFAASLTGLAFVPLERVDAAGTVLIQQRDGVTKVYKNVHVRVGNESMTLTSADSVGTLVLGKAACTKEGELLRCIPYDATLEQNGRATHISLAMGTVWLNPSSSSQTLSHSTQRLQPRGVLLSIRTHAGTYVSLSGTVDEVYQ